MSAWTKSTLVAARVRSRARARDSAETSTAVNCASGLRATSVAVWAPTPQPASSTRLPAG